MPLPQWRDRTPGRQSILKRVVQNILNSDLVHRFGPTGASATVTHGLVSPQAPLGPPPQEDDYGRNPMFHEGESVAMPTMPIIRRARRRR